MKIFSTLLAITITTLFISGCSDDTTTNTPVVGKNYISFSTGNYWIYTNTTIDDKGAAVGTPSVDSTVVLQQTTKGGKSASMLVTYNEGNADTSYYYKGTDNSIYQWFDIDLQSLVSGTTATIPQFWAKVLAGDKAVSTSLDTTIKGIEYDLNGTKIPLDIKFKVTSQSGNDTTITFNGTTYSAAQSTSTLSVIAYQANTTVAILTLSTPQKIVYLENNGIFSTYTPGVNLFGTPINGSKTMLTKMSVK
ncbi:MAG: hypothetical protein U0Y96_09985 [Candidatus Kapaibacterium sp.]|nr:hypothetical protein [Bacteroidota bacterium]